MNRTTRTIVTIVLTGIWVNASEFLRNEVLLRSHWVEHYRSLGQTFPSAPLNGMLWIIWGFLLSIACYAVSRKFTLVQTALITWLLAFAMMWVVAWNLLVLPTSIMVYAIPLSILEVVVASFICLKVSPRA